MPDTPDDHSAKRLVVRAADGSTGIMGLMLPPFPSSIATTSGAVHLVRVMPNYVMYAEEIAAHE